MQQLYPRPLTHVLLCFSITFDDDHDENALPEILISSTLHLQIP